MAEPKEDRVPLSLEHEILNLEDTHKKTDVLRQELMDKIFAGVRATEITAETLQNKGAREAITAMIKMGADILNDTEGAQHKRIAAKTRLKEANGNEKIAEYGIEMLRQLGRGDLSIERELPTDLENVQLDLHDDEHIPQTMLKLDPNDTSV